MREYAGGPTPEARLRLSPPSRGVELLTSCLSGPRGRPQSAPAVAFVCPAWAPTRRCKSFGDLVAGTRANRQATGREASAESSGRARPAGRRTETGYEAGPTRASGQMTAKLFATKGSPVDPALVQGQSVRLPGEISPHVRTDDVTRQSSGAEREVSRGHSSRAGAPAWRRAEQQGE